MDEIADIIVKLHAAPPKAVLIAAGAGSSALAWLLSVPGASRTLLEARVPYGRGCNDRPVGVGTGTVCFANHGPGSGQEPPTAGVCYCGRTIPP